MIVIIIVYVLDEKPKQLPQNKKGNGKYIEDSWKLHVGDKLVSSKLQLPATIRSMLQLFALINWKFAQELVIQNLSHSFNSFQGKWYVGEKFNQLQVKR